ncbi:hypothetical protein [Paramagnetospirillum magneticum]|uniref:Uncharacterized protein n=1 Tax=Paramagnetospirillum magneticum (strain ATCC 700264 / AMB-1) TaxID=342108 RepID=Q2W624_PARM1|nr:hypothetical protein [Paramagnetospirillum magneticum]BAE50701.1 hypothetical protein amb1897 [Paramagnetospirillum magneticum AMB-1]
MAFELPNLDTVSAQQLLAELMRRIPMFTPLWTDFNESDPGITVLEMLCWVGESLLYQTNAIPLETWQNMLRLCLGLANSTDTTDYSVAAVKQNDFAFLALQAVLARMEQGAPLDREALQAAVLTFRRAPYLALTGPDVEQLAMETNQVIAQQPPVKPPPALVRRADALVDDQQTVVHILDDATPVYQRPSCANPKAPDAQGGLRNLLMLQPAGASATAALTKLLATVTTYLAPRVLLGNRVSVVGATLTPITMTVRVVCQPHARASVVLAALSSALFDFFQPGADWVYDQPPSVANLRHLIAAIPGVQTLARMDLSYAPTAILSKTAQLGATTLIADLPQTPPAMIYAGLPLLRCLDLFAQEVGS